MVDPLTQRAFVGNITDHSISVLDVSGSPITPIDVAPLARATRGRFFDDDRSGSRAELDVTVLASEDVPDERWVLDWVEGSVRLWAPEAGGLRRVHSGGSGYVSSAWGIELDPEDSDGLLTEVVDPFVSLSGSVPTMLFSEQGDIFEITSITAGAWEWSSLDVLLGGGSSSACCGG